MPVRHDLLLRNATVVNHDGVGRRDVAVSHGRIAGIGSFEASHAAETIDCTGLHLLPGVIDAHVHFREPGAEHKEDFETGSRAAAVLGTRDDDSSDPDVVFPYLARIAEET